MLYPAHLIPEALLDIEIPTNHRYGIGGPEQEVLQRVWGAAYGQK
jgi:hypothetical protein